MNENIRKIFDMLGVEPGETFKVKGYEGDFKIYKDLMSVRWGVSNKDNFNFYSWFIDILINPNKIIKLPKKKKKLRDLTKKEYEKWQENNCGKDNPCYNCLFKNIPCHSFIDVCWINHKDLYSDKFLDQEVEVEE